MRPEFLRARRRGRSALQLPAPSVSLLVRPRLLRSLDAILWGGGHLLQDDSSQFKCLYWAAALRLLRILSGRPIIGFGVGVGPLHTRSGRFFARVALGALDDLVVRDEGSAEWVRRAGAPRGSIRVAPDPAVTLQPAPRDEALRYLADGEGIRLAPGERLIGVGLRRWFHLERGQVVPHRWRSILPVRLKPDAGLFDQLKANLADALNRLAADAPQRVLLFPMYTVPWEADDRESADLAARLRCPAHVLSLRCRPHVAKAVAGLCDLFVGVRLHSAILALGMGVPTIGIGYAEKHALFARVGQAARWLDIGRAARADGADELHRLFRDAVVRRKEISAEIAGQWRKLQAEAGLYEDVLRGIGSP